MNGVATQEQRVRRRVRPRLGFVGVGWIGRHRMEALVEEGLAEPAAIADPDPELAEAARTVAPEAARYRDLEELLAAEEGLDGVVIATPSALHAGQSIRALEAGLPVFCQKPLGRNAGETRRVIEAARSADRLLGVDLSYRFVRGVPEMRRLIRDGALGQVYAADLVFHNAYGPDKAWFRDPRRSGGGCVIDLGIHLVDLALWMLDFPEVGDVSSRLFAEGTPLAERPGAVEDYAVARLDLEGGPAVTLACSWHLPAGCDAVIEAVFYGTEGGLALRNVDGSFYDFVVERFRGTDRERIAGPPDAWGGRAAATWAERLARSAAFDSGVAHLLPVAEVLDAIYRQGGRTLQDP